MEQLTKAQKAQKTRAEHASKRKAKEEQARREYASMRKRLIQIIDADDTTNADSLDAIRILWEMDKAEHYHLRNL